MRVGGPYRITASFLGFQNQVIEAIKAAVNEAVKAESAEPSGLLDAVFKVVSA